MTTPAPMSVSPACPACGHPGGRPMGHVGGYVRGPRFDVIECARCRTQRVTPREVPTGLYDAIYANTSVIDGGYDRYVRYAEGIRGVPRPLEWLAGQEDMYWGVSRALLAAGARAGDRIVEAGSGLGYLTYALRAAGYDAHGVDLSHVAVKAASERFGALYSQGDAADPLQIHDARVVIAMELIEHLPDPESFLTGLRRALPAAASVIVSTPNRDAYPDTVMWNTDLPPVHLQWFSEEGITALARRCGFDTEFVDFSERNAAGVHRRWIAGDAYRQPRFDESLQPIQRDATVAAPRWTPARIVAAVGRRLSRLERASRALDENRLTGTKSVALVARLVPAA
jgi:SAM-dependent methyltransferase